MKAKLQFIKNNYMLESFVTEMEVEGKMINMVNEEKGKKFKRATSLVLMGAVCAASVFSAGAFSRQVNVNADNRTISTITSTGDTFKILERVGVTVNQGDTVERSDEIDGSLKLDVKRAFDVFVSRGNFTVLVKISSGTVKDAIEQSGIKLEKDDMCNFSLDKTLESGMHIRISRKVNIKLMADGETKEYSVPCGTVYSAFEFLGFDVSADDIVNVDVSSEIYDGMEINVSRVTYREISKTEEIPFKTVVKKSHLLDDSQKEVSALGKNGEREVRFKETLVDGKVVKSEEIDSKVISEPVDEVVLEGTKSNSSQNVTKKDDSKDNLQVSSKKGSRMISGFATAYTAPAGSKTSTGVTPVQGVTLAVNPNLIPYGSSITVETIDGKVLFKGKAQDTGGALRRGRAVVDVYMNTEKACNKFGRKKVNVYFN